MSNLEVRVGIIYLEEGVPNPTAINDTIDHVGGEDAHFNWTNGNGMLAKPTHYVVSDGKLGWIKEDYDTIWDLCLSALTATEDLQEEGLEGVVIHNDAGIQQLDLDVQDSEFKFTTTKVPDVWVYGTWR